MCSIFSPLLSLQDAGLAAALRRRAACEEARAAEALQAAARELVEGGELLQHAEVGLGNSRLLGGWGFSSW
jgi:hypothetical protein